MMFKRIFPLIFTHILSLIFILSCGPSSGSNVTIPAPSDNLSPIANAGKDQTLPKTSSFHVLLDGSNSKDPERDPLSYHWRFLSLPSDSDAIIKDASSIHPSFSADVSGDYHIVLEVSDGRLSSTDQIWVRKHTD